MKEFPTQQRQIVEHIKKNLAKGYNVDTLKYALIGQGYSRTAVDNALKTATQETSSLSHQSLKSKEKPQITYKIVDDEEMKQIQEKAKMDIEGSSNIIQRFLRKIFD